MSCEEKTPTALCFVEQEEAVEPEAAQAATPVPRRKRRRRRIPVPDQDWITTEQAAALLGLDEESLRARARRSLGLEGKLQVARLGPIIAMKFGRTWRFRVVGG